MKKHFILAAALALLPGLAWAQTNIHIQQLANSSTSTATHFMVDASKPTDNSFSYALFSDDISDAGNFAFIQLFHEHKFWDAPIFLHAEYRSYNLDSHVLYLGAAYDFFTAHGMIAVEPLVRNNAFFAGNSKPVLDMTGTSAQLSVVTGHDWGFCNLNSFTDIWAAPKNGTGAGWYSEAWLYFPVTSWLQLGSIGCFSWDFNNNPALSVYLGVKFNLQ